MRIFLLISFLFAVIETTAQNDSILVKVMIGAENRDLQDMLRFEGIEQLKVTLIGKPIKDKVVNILYEEFDNGLVISKGKLSQGLSEMYYKPTGDSISIKILCKATGDSAQINFFYPRFSTKTFFKLRPPHEDYSMRFALPLKENLAKISLNNEKQALFVYSHPYKRPDDPKMYYCELTSNGVEPSKWFKEYHVKHYFVFYVQFD